MMSYYLLIDTNVPQLLGSTLYDSWDKASMMFVQVMFQKLYNKSTQEELNKLLSQIYIQEYNLFGFPNGIITMDITYKYLIRTINNTKTYIDISTLNLQLPSYVISENVKSDKTNKTNKTNKSIKQNPLEDISKLLKTMNEKSQKTKSFIPNVLPEVKTNNNDLNVVSDNFSCYEEEEILNNVSSNSGLFGDNDDDDWYSEYDDLEKIKDVIDKLEELKKEKEKQVKEEEEELNKEVMNSEQYLTQLNNSKRQMRVDQDKEEQRKNIFESGKYTYKKISEDIESGKLNLVPALFSDKYPIYKFLDKKQLLDTDKDYVTYLKLFNVLKKDEKNHINSDKAGFVPHNIHYLTEEEQKKYLPHTQQFTDLITEFMEDNQKSDTNINSFDQVLSDLDHEIIPSDQQDLTMQDNPSTFPL